MQKKSKHGIKVLGVGTAGAHTLLLHALSNETEDISAVALMGDEDHHPAVSLIEDCKFQDGIKGRGGSKGLGSGMAGAQTLLLRALSIRRIISR